MIRLGSALFAILAACSSCATDDAQCSSVTTYQGTTVTCDEGYGVCVDRGGPWCLPRCSRSSPLCGDGEQWRTIAVADGPPVCYCDPAIGGAL